MIIKSLNDAFIKEPNISIETMSDTLIILSLLLISIAITIFILYTINEVFKSLAS